ncbi:MAG: peptide ABC transporter substrate-binding protein [Oscillospiraceae bacterium]|nr:peptide ABC transporter substrate-binding protein [Oscillospiraceae bacterium]
MKHIRRTAFIFLFIFLVTLVPSCTEDDGSGHIFKMNIENNPKNLDPQLAEDKESLIIIENMLEGLVRVLPEGGIVPAAAESFDMSEDGLTYTFYLKQGREWESLADFSEPVTADDFVYTFHRLFDPDIGSPYGKDYVCIKNGSAVLNGTKGLNDLGVKALDEYTVEFTLEYPYYDFLSLLARSSAMPCCEKFFVFSKGRYGMAADAVASNGAFYLKEWNFDPYWDNNYLIMRRNISYSEKNYVYPYSLNFFITGDGTEHRDDFLSGNTDCCIADRYDEKLFNDAVSYGVDSKTAGLVFNPNSEYFGSKPFREALAKSLNREEYARSLPQGLTVAYGVIPAGITVQGRSYRELVPDRTFSVYDAGFAEFWETALKSMKLDSVDNVKITVPDSFSGIDIIYDITDYWRENLLFDCGIEVVSENEYNEKVESGDYEILLTELTAEQDSAYELLENFVNRGCFKSSEVPDLMAVLNSSKTAVSISDGTERFRTAETRIIENYLFVPICYESRYLVCGEDAADLAYYPFDDTIWFGEAKYFD